MAVDAEALPVMASSGLDGEKLARTHRAVGTPNRPYLYIVDTLYFVAHDSTSSAIQPDPEYGAA